MYRLTSLSRLVMYVSACYICRYDSRLEMQDARTWLPQLGALANSRLKLLIWVRAHKITVWILNDLAPTFNRQAMQT